MDSYLNLENKLYKDILKYPPNEQAIIKKAYIFAKMMHNNQFRKSGEPYIIHPIWVALIIISLNGDYKTVASALLHDVVEDTSISIMQIDKMFDSEIAMLVDGVSKIRSSNGIKKNELNLASLRKLLLYFQKDARIIALKLADRYHNILTLKYLNSEKQKVKAIETLEIFSPIADKIGAYEIKNVLEDASLKALLPNVYENLYMQKKEYQNKNVNVLVNMMDRLTKELKENNINVKIRYQGKNIYSIYRQFELNHKLENLHDLFSLVIVADNKSDCYKAREYIKQNYENVPRFERDYIKNPKTNLYQSIHLSIYYQKILLQLKIRTEEMDIISTQGLIGYWSLYGDKARIKMQKYLSNSGLEAIWQLDKRIKDNQEFVNIIKQEVLGKSLHIYDESGNSHDIPIGTSVIDFATDFYLDDLKIDYEFYINGKLEPATYILQDNDYVAISRVLKKENHT